MRQTFVAVRECLERFGSGKEASKYFHIDVAARNIYVSASSVPEYGLDPLEQCPFTAFPERRRKDGRPATIGSQLGGELSKTPLLVSRDFWLSLIL